MTYDEETSLINDVQQIKKEVRENNVMLKEIIKYINYISFNANNENENDFMRNVLANLLSNINFINK